MSNESDLKFGAAAAVCDGGRFADCAVCVAMAAAPIATGPPPQPSAPPMRLVMSKEAYELWIIKRSAAASATEAGSG